MFAPCTLLQSESNACFSHCSLLRIGLRSFTISTDEFDMVIVCFCMLLDCFEVSSLKQVDGAVL